MIMPKMGVIIVIVIRNGTFDDFGVFKNDQKVWRFSRKILQEQTKVASYIFSKYYT